MASHISWGFYLTNRPLFSRFRFLRHLKARTLLIPAVAWLPLAIFALVEREVFGVKGSFISDISVHVRLLFCVPVLLLAERLVGGAVFSASRHFVEAGIVDPNNPETLRAYFALRKRCSKLRDSAGVSIGLVLSAFLLSSVSINIETLGQTSWLVRGSSLSLAGMWWAVVSLPLFLLLAFRWLWRWIVWTFFLFGVSKLPIRLLATHPDRAGGLAFLAYPAQTFCLVLLAFSAALSSNWGYRITQGMDSTASKEALGLFVFLLFSVFITPFLAFTRKLTVVKNRAVERYGTLGQVHHHQFEEAWLDRPLDELILGKIQVDRLTDFATSFDVILHLHKVPLGRDTLILFVGAVLAPMLPLIATVVPLGELLGNLARGLL